jgi:quercetin dioxygenase-like cupin family protein
MGQRRIVTGHAEHGDSVILEDGEVPVSYELPGGFRFSEVWSTAATPAPLAPGEPEPTRADIGIAPPAQGSLARVIETPPGAKVPLHRTESLDYAVVLDGEMTLIMDDGSETILRRGDTVVQRGTAHGWENRGSEPVTMFFAVVGGAFTEGLEGLESTV